MYQIVKFTPQKRATITRLSPGADGFEHIQKAGLTEAETKALEIMPGGYSEETACRIIALLEDGLRPADIVRRLQSDRRNPVSRANVYRYTKALPHRHKKP